MKKEKNSPRIMLIPIVFTLSIIVFVTYKREQKRDRYVEENYIRYDCNILYCKLIPKWND